MFLARLTGGLDKLLLLRLCGYLGGKGCIKMYLEVGSSPRIKGMAFYLHRLESASWNPCQNHCLQRRDPRSEKCSARQMSELSRRRALLFRHRMSQVHLEAKLTSTLRVALVAVGLT